MGDKISLKLDPRELQGKKVAQLRKDGLVPGVVYGPNTDPINVQVDAVVIEKTYRRAGTHSPVSLTIDGKRKIAMIKEVDRDPVKGTMRHISFHAVKADQPVVAEVPVRLVGEGESEAERNGLIVLQNLEKIEVRALPMDLPEAVEIDITALSEAGEKITLAAATLPEGVELVEHDTGHHEQLEEGEEKPTILDTMVASVWEPAALQAANEAAAGDGEDESSVESENGSEGADASGTEASNTSDSEGKPDEQTKPE